MYHGHDSLYTVAVSASAPRLFPVTNDGKGDATLAHTDNTLITADSPAKPGEVVTRYLEGLGAGDGGAAGPLNLRTTPYRLFVQTPERKHSGAHESRREFPVQYAERVSQP